MGSLGWKNILLMSGAGATFLLSASPSQAAVINLYDLTGWETIGNASSSGGQVSLSSSGGVSRFSIEQFLELPNQALNSLNSSPTNGSALKTTITVNAGDVLEFDWRFSTNDYLPYNDFSFYSIGSLVTKLADVALVGNYGNTTSKTSYTFDQDGKYTLGFGVVNSRDTAVNSTLTVNNVLESVKPVPEPFTILASLTTAGLGVALRRKQKQAANKSIV
ncbi:PEP-CTERM sorting domain-containing protein [Anabaena sp. CA = ATCC 33047]|uniref:PEP-CTERM sorting domain-containing protein n=1 Tax=Anabaena sp. (strain CA / ATCC 33047) TaxID=52271 RepID=UPI00082B051D|nr:PEP-CTERM sorting domain-containing protein [Anabaena sp. CA = ATCC 33047]